MLKSTDPPTSRRDVLHAALLLPLLALPLASAGCSGQDHLRVSNQYPFPVRVRVRGQVIGTVPAGETRTFRGAAGYKGSLLRGAAFETEQGTTLGAVREDMARREDVSRFNGVATWSVVAAPAES
ncbi:MAG TPA: hypothetical protein VM490_17400 [Armatimonadaceae bacterium]|nr:hypothetical protein [Armatimonadaceae bacterium]